MPFTRGRARELGEVVLASHGVHQVVGYLDPVQRRWERFGVQEVTLDNLNGVPPIVRSGPLGAANQHPHIVLAGQQAVDQSTPHVPGRPRDENLHGPSTWW